jgi:hypothetical protein
MNRLRRWSVVCFVMVGAVGFTWADDQPPAVAKTGEEKWLVDRAIKFTPRAEPAPALRYRLLPLASELKEGNAVPIYLRLTLGKNEVERNNWNLTPAKWNELPVDQVPNAEARKFLDEMAPFYEQLDFGARRRVAEWNYTIEQPDPIGMRLPDLLVMRQCAPMMVLRVRMRIADGDYAGAARAFETGFSFSRQVAEDGPFLIGGLVGLAIATMHADRIPEWIERPDSPNLYWALTALPRPLITLRRQMEFEHRVFEMQFPDLADLDKPRSPGEWDAALKRFRAEARRIDLLINSPESGIKQPDKQPPPPDPDEPAAKSSDLSAARKFVAKQLGKSAADVEAMPPAQVLLLSISGEYSNLRDDVFKVTYLPFPQAHPLLPEMDRRLRAVTGGEGVRLAKLFLPAISKVMVAQIRLERKIALLRAVEVLRLHAAASAGQLPDSLDQVTAAPVPLDPGTGKPFEYQRDGATATLSSRLPGEPLENTGLRYRLTVREKR